MSAKKTYQYNIERTPTTGDWLIGRFWWNVMLDRDHWERKSGFAYSYNGAMKKIRKAIKQWEDAKNRGEILHVEGKTSGS